MREKIGLGGGCHWCTEAVFQSLKDVTEVRQGWISSGEFPTFSEGILVEYDPDLIPLEILIKIHLSTHSSTSDHAMRNKYRSAVYAFTEEQRMEVERLIRALQGEYSKKIITQPLTFRKFKLNTEDYQEYYRKDPQRPFCRNVIAPKIRKLLREYGKWTHQHLLV